MKSRITIFFLFNVFFWNLSFSQDTSSTKLDSFINKYRIDLHVTYNIDSTDLTSVFIPFYGEKEAYFVDYFGNRKGKEVFDDIQLIEHHPFYWGKKNDKYFLYRFPETQVFNRSFDRPWGFGKMDFKDTYYLSPRGYDNERVIFTKTNEGNINNISQGIILSYHANFPKDFDVDSQDLYPLIRLNKDDQKMIVAINGDVLYECINCEIHNIHNQRRFVKVKPKGGDFRIFDVEKQSFLEGEFTSIGRSSGTINTFYAIENTSDQRISFFNEKGANLYRTTAEEFKRIEGNVYYFTNPDSYQMVNIESGEIISSSSNPIRRKVINDKLYLLDEERNIWYDAANTKLEEMIAFDTGEKVTARVTAKKNPSPIPSLYVYHEGKKYNVAYDSKYGWIGPDSSWVIEPKYRQIKILGTEGFYMASKYVGDHIEYALLKFPDEIIYPFERRKLSINQHYPFDLYYLLIEDFGTSIGINSSFQIVYDPDTLHISPDDLEFKDEEGETVRNIKKNKFYLPYMVYGNYKNGFVYDSKGNFKYSIDGNASSQTTAFGFEEKNKYHNLPILPLGEFRKKRSRKATLFRFEDGYVFGKKE